jgi:hypothetical protein
MTLGQRAPETLLKRVPARAGDAAALSRLAGDLDGQLGQGGQDPLLALHLGGEAALLLLQGAREKR